MLDCVVEADEICQSQSIY